MSRTVMLCFQYLDMVEILSKYIQDERMGNFYLHLPYFAAAGHHLYTKSTYMYLQSMSKLEITHPNVYQKFIVGYHVVRRSNRLWSGLSTDLIIEQVLMRSLKTSGSWSRNDEAAKSSVVVIYTCLCRNEGNAMQCNPLLG